MWSSDRKCLRNIKYYCSGKKSIRKIKNAAKCEGKLEVCMWEILFCWVNLYCSLSWPWRFICSCMAFPEISNKEQLRATYSSVRGRHMEREREVLGGKRYHTNWQIWRILWDSPLEKSQGQPGRPAWNSVGGIFGHRFPSSCCPVTAAPKDMFVMPASKAVWWLLSAWERQLRSWGQGNRSVFVVKEKLNFQN